MTGTIQEALDFYRQRLGMGETPPGSNHNAITQEFGFDGPWCCMTFSLAMRHAGVPVPPNAACANMEAWFKSQGRMIPVPLVGAAAMYRWGGPGVGIAHHIGIVESVGAGGTFVALEGNCGDHITRIVRSTHHGYGVTFGMPPYATGVLSVPSSVPNIDLKFAPKSPLWWNNNGNDTVAVKVLQMDLNLVTGRGLVVDGVYGDATRQCVADLQRILTIPVSGQYDDKTHYLLQLLLNKKLGH